MAKKIRKKGRRRISKLNLGLLVLATVILAIVAIGMIGGPNESDGILSGFFFEIILFGTAFLVAPLIIRSIGKLKRKDKGEGDNPPYY